MQIAHLLSTGGILQFYADMELFNSIKNINSLLILTVKKVEKKAAVLEKRHRSL